MIEKGQRSWRTFYIAFGHDEEVRNFWKFNGKPCVLSTRVAYDYISTNVYIFIKISGKRGAQELAKTLTKRGVVRLDFVLDEGFPLTKDLFPGTDRPIAL